MVSSTPAPPVYFVDTSALVKRYMAEAGSAWLRAALDPASARPVFIARVTTVEMIAALTRRERGGSLSPADATVARTDFRDHLSTHYAVLEVTPALDERAIALTETHGLRGYDALQLAAGLQVNARSLRRGLPPITLLSADAELNAAARAEGLAVEDPGAHP